MTQRFNKFVALWWGLLPALLCACPPAAIAPADKQTPVGELVLSYYFVTVEHDYPGAPQTQLFDAHCKPLLKVTKRFADELSVQGSGRLPDGRVLNIAKRCSCAAAVRFCYALLDQNRYPFGQGSTGRPLVPLRSVAVDPEIVPLGSTLYLPCWKGIEIPEREGVGGFVHDGCFRADDVGGAIKGPRYDLFAGMRLMWLALERLVPTRKKCAAYVNSRRCIEMKKKR